MHKVTDPMPECRILPDELPRDELHSRILVEIAEKDLPVEEAAKYFWLPGVGFHRSMFYMSMHWLSFRKSGSNVFKIDPDLQNALVRTSLEGLSAEDINLPFQTVWVAFPGEGLEVWGGDQTLWHKAEGAFVAHTKGRRSKIDPETLEFTETVLDDSDPGSLSIYVWGAENERSSGPGDDACFWWTIDLLEVQESGLDLETYLVRMLEDPTRDDTRSGLSQAALDLGLLTELPKSGSLRERTVSSMVDIARVIINAILYANSDGAKVEADSENEALLEKRGKLLEQGERAKSPGKKKKYRQKANKTPPTRILWLGGPPGKGTESARSSGPRSPSSTHWVRGHWWPKKLTLRQRLSVVDADVSKTSALLHEVEASLRGAAAPSELAERVQETLNLRSLLTKATDRAGEIRTSLDGRLRWVEPYERCKDAGSPSPGKVYGLK